MSAFIKRVISVLLITGLLGCKAGNGTGNGLNNSKESLPESSVTAIPDEEHKTLLLQTKQAIINLDETLVKELSVKIDVNRPLPDQSSLLAWAIETQDPQIVGLLLKEGANPWGNKVSRFPPLIQACRYGNADIMTMLLEQDFDPANIRTDPIADRINSTINRPLEDGTSPLHLCAGSTSADVLSKLVKLGADIKVENNYGQTPLMWAANSAKVNNINYLVSNGARINHQTQEGYSPLFFAVKSQNLDAIKAVIARGADLFATAKDGTTATQLAVYTENYQFLTWYINALGSLMTPEAIKNTITAFDRNGHQLLHAAVHANQPELVSALLTLGADPTSVSEPSKLTWRYEANFKTEGYHPPQQTPLEIAEQKDFQTIISMLRQ